MGKHRMTRQDKKHPPKNMRMYSRYTCSVTGATTHFLTVGTTGVKEFIKCADGRHTSLWSAADTVEYKETHDGNPPPLWKTVSHDYLIRTKIEG